MSSAWHRAAAIGAAAVLLAGCAELRSERVADYGKPLEPTFYYLEKRVFEIAIVVTATGCEVGNSGANIKSDIAVIYTPYLVADKDYSFQIPQRALTSLVKTTEFTITFYPDRTIKSVNSAIADKTAEIIEKVVDTAASIAGTFFFGRPSVPKGGVVPQGFLPTRPPSDTPNICAPVLKAINEEKTAKAALNAAVADQDYMQSLVSGFTTALGVAAHNHAPYVIARANAERRLAAAKSKVAKLESDAAEKSRKLRLVAQAKWDPEIGQGEDGAFRIKPYVLSLSTIFAEQGKRANTVFKESSSDTLNDLKFEISFGEADAKFLRPTDPTVARAASVDGLVLRVPVTGTVRAAESAKGANDWKHVALTARSSAAGSAAGLTFPQFGPVILVKLRNGPFENNNIQVEFNDDGTISKFSFGSQAVLLAAAGSAARTASQIDALIKSQTTRENDRLKLEKERLQLEKDIRDLRRQLSD